MPKQVNTTKKVGNRAKGRQHQKGVDSGKYKRQALRTEENRIKKWRKHVKTHPNYIQGIEKMKKALGI